MASSFEEGDDSASTTGSESDRTRFAGEAVAPSGCLEKNEIRIVLFAGCFSGAIALVGMRRQLVRCRQAA